MGNSVKLLEWTGELAIHCWLTFLHNMPHFSFSCEQMLRPTIVYPISIARYSLVHYCLLCTAYSSACCFASVIKKHNNLSLIKLEAKLSVVGATELDELGMVNPDRVMQVNWTCRSS